MFLSEKMKFYNHLQKLEQRQYLLLTRRIWVQKPFNIKSEILMHLAKHKVSMIVLFPQEQNPTLYTIERCVANRFCRTVSLWLQFKHNSSTRSTPLRITRRVSDVETVYNCIGSNMLHNDISILSQNS